MGGRGVHTAFTSNLYKDIICLKLPQKVAHNGLTQFNLEKMRIVLSRKHAFFFWELVLKGNRAFFLGGEGDLVSLIMWSLLVVSRLFFGKKILKS